MSLHIRKGGVWQEPVGCMVYANGRWRRIARIKCFADGAWRDVANFTSPGSGGSSTPGGGGTGTGTGGGSSSPSITLTVSPSSTSRTGKAMDQTSAVLTATPSGGKAPYSYTWSFVSRSGAVFSFDSPTLASTTVTASGLIEDLQATCTVHCTVRDSLGTTDVSNNATCTFLRNVAFGTGGSQSSL